MTSLTVVAPTLTAKLLSVNSRSSDGQKCVAFSLSLPENVKFIIIFLKNKLKINVNTNKTWEPGKKKSDTFSLT